MEKQMIQEVFSDSYASLGRRILAFGIDLLILALPCAIAGKLIPVLGGLAVWFFYGPVLESSRMKATLGKYLLGIQVVDHLGRRISLKAAVIRNILKCISTLLLFIGFFFALFTRRKQTLHDLFADTLVIYGRSDESIAQAWLDRVKSIRLDETYGNTPGGNSEDSVISKLERLKSLRDQGILTQQEFEDQKRKILQNT